jgi:SOS-response transcriptional repressor LexA
MAKVGRWIRERRDSLKLTRDDLSRLTRVSPATLARLESDQGERNPATLHAVARALRVEPPDLLTDWAQDRLTEAQFMRAIEGIAPGDSPSKIERMLAERRLQRASQLAQTARGTPLPRAEFMTAEPGKGTPVLGEITAGGFVESIVFEGDEAPERVPLFYPGKHRTYALRIRGDSMSPEYRAGEILIVQDATPDELEDGEDAVIQCNGGNDGCSTFKRCVFLGNGLIRLMPLNGAYKPLECTLDHIVRIGKVLGVYRPRSGGSKTP